jgi:hypothetical protein
MRERPDWDAVDIASFSMRIASMIPGAALLRGPFFNCAGYLRSLGSIRLLRKRILSARETSD